MPHYELCLYDADACGLVRMRRMCVMRLACIALRVYVLAVF